MPRVCPSPHPRTLDSALAGRGSSSPHPTVAPEPRGVASVAKGPQRDRSPHACGLRRAIAPAGREVTSSLLAADYLASPLLSPARLAARSPCAGRSARSPLTSLAVRCVSRGLSVCHFAPARRLPLCVPRPSPLRRPAPARLAAHAPRAGLFLTVSPPPSPLQVAACLRCVLPSRAIRTREVRWIRLSRS